MSAAENDYFDVDAFADDHEHTDDDNPSGVRHSEFTIGDHVELGAKLIEHLGLEEHLVYDEGELRQYEPSGLWKRVETSTQSRIVQGFSGSPVRPNSKPLRVKAADVTGAIKLAHDRVTREGFFTNATGVAFANGVVRLTEGGEIEVLPHSPDNRVRAGYPFPFEYRALPRRFLAFLYDVFRDDEDRGDKECLIQEFYGACALGIAPRYQRAIVGLGVAAGNGKSTLATAMNDAMPEGTTSAIAPQDLGQEYRRALLVGKHLNSVNELPDRDIIASEAFKAIVTGDPIVGRAIRQSPVTFCSRAGHAFFANKLPGTSDQTDGFWRRFLVLTFNRSFTNDPDRDPDLGVKLRDERALIVSWLVEGAARLVRERGYTIPRSHHAALAAWKKNANQVALFVDAELRPLRVDEGVAMGTAGASLYETYKRWSERNGHRPMASNKFAERMQDLGLAATKTNRGMRYPVAVLTEVDRVQAGAGWVQGHPSLQTIGVANA